MVAAGLPDITFLLDDGTGTYPYDITQYVDLSTGYSITRGRTSTFDNVQATNLRATLDNTSGRFTPGGFTGNLVTNPSAETNTTGWSVIGATVARSTTQHWYGAASFKITWPTGAANASSVYYTVTGLTVGSTYTYSAYVYVPTSMPRVKLKAGASTFSANSSVTNAWQRLSLVFVATATSQAIEVVNVDASTSGNNAYFDGVLYEAGSELGTYMEPGDIVVNQKIRVTHTIGGTTFYRFTGYVQDWPVEWPGGRNGSQSAITATDRLARLERRKLLSIAKAEILSYSPTLFYAMDEPDKATSSTNYAGTSLLPLVQEGTGANVAYGAANGPDGSTNSAPSFTAGKNLVVRGGPFNTGDCTIMIWVKTTDTAVRDIATLHSMDGSFVSLWKNGANFYVTYADPPGGIDPTNISSTTAINNGLWHCLAVKITSGSIYLQYDGYDITNSVTGVSAAFDTLRVGDGFFGAGWQGNLSQVCVFPSVVDSNSPWIGTYSGFADESTDYRVARYARYANIPVADQSLAPGVLALCAPYDTSGVTVLGAMQMTTDSEGGLLFVAGDGKLTLQNRYYRNSETFPTVTIDAGDLGEDAKFSCDTQYLVNYVTAHNQNGVVQVSQNTTSITEHEQYPKDLTLVVPTDREAKDAGDWLVAIHGEPSARLPDVRYDLMVQDSATQQGIQSIELSDRVAFTNLPPQAPIVGDQLIEGWTENVSFTKWEMELSTSSYADVRAWILGDATNGALNGPNRLSY